jgi:effector-binding domain-containing protein
VRTPIYSLKIVALVLFFISYSGVVMAISEPKFSVESKTDEYEIRAYSSTIVAQTVVEGSFDDAGNKAFRILADYIFGNNKSKIKIDMTAPVAQQPSSQKIAMTAPVSQIKNSSGFLVQFTMPDEYKMNTLPEPNDSRVQLVEVPARKVAVFSYSGSWSEDRYKSKLEEFNKALLKNNLKTTGEPVFARFNSPFQIWFLRRNEIWLQVAP